MRDSRTGATIADYGRFKRLSPTTIVFFNKNTISFACSYVGINLLIPILKSSVKKIFSTKIKKKLSLSHLHFEEYRKINLRFTFTSIKLFRTMPRNPS